MYIYPLYYVVGRLIIVSCLDSAASFFIQYAIDNIPNLVVNVWVHPLYTLYICSPYTGGFEWVFSTDQGFYRSSWPFYYYNP